jgi:hypothetical protein
MLGLALVLALMAAFSGVIVALFKGEPQWYHAPALAPQQKETLARDAENKLIEAQNWAALLRADAVRAQRATETIAATVPAPRAENSHVIELTQDELNSLFEKWSAMYGWQSKYGEFLENPRLILHDGKLIFAGRIKEIGTVASFQFLPQVDEQGKLHLDLVRVMGGRLPLPDAVWSTWRNKLIQSLRGHIPGWKATAKIDPITGAANLSAVSVALSKVLISALERKPADAVLFLPIVDRGEAIAVRVSQVQVEEGKLTLLVLPLSIPERSALLKRLRSE